MLTLGPSSWLGLLHQRDGRRLLTEGTAGLVGHRGPGRDRREVLPGQRAQQQTESGHLSQRQAQHAGDRRHAAGLADPPGHGPAAVTGHVTGGVEDVQQRSEPSLPAPGDERPRSIVGQQLAPGPDAVPGMAHIRPRRHHDQLPFPVVIGRRPGGLGPAGRAGQQRAANRLGKLGVIAQDRAHLDNPLRPARRPGVAEAESGDVPSCQLLGAGDRRACLGQGLGEGPQHPEVVPRGTGPFDPRPGAGPACERPG